MRLRDAFESGDAKRRYNRALFATIADRYDLITRVLSFGLDQRWKRRLLQLAAIETGRDVLDLACGTGDLAFAAASAGGRVTGLDLTPKMIALARRRAVREPGVRGWIVGDMTSLPLPDARFHAITTGYGLRNVPDLPRAISESARVLAPGGVFVSLDFDRPANPLVRGVYLAWLTIVGSTLGWLLHGDPDTYRYIPASIRRYPGADRVADLLRQAGFSRVAVLPVLGGLMAIHVARR
jgi:demethylmenaquinone methyltransferase/2-methoxy-6-polyprenyl-1,4-benzoquinol methylase